MPRNAILAAIEAANAERDYPTVVDLADGLSLVRSDVAVRLSRLHSAGKIRVVGRTAKPYPLNRWAA